MNRFRDNENFRNLTFAQLTSWTVEPNSKPLPKIVYPPNWKTTLQQTTYRPKVELVD